MQLTPVMSYSIVIHVKMISVRLEAETWAKLQRLARRGRMTQSTVVREAVEAYGEPDEKPVGSKTALDRLGPYIGAVSSGGANLSSNTHAAYRASLIAKHRARRSR